MTTLAQKVAIVTGASSGIGEATALALGRQHAKVVLAARRTDRIDALARQIIDAGGHAAAVTCDVADRAQVEAVVETALRDFGGVDILINNAGIMPLAPMARCRMDDWDAMIDVNIKGLLYGIGLVLPTMLDQGTGHIVNVSSVAGRRTFPGAAVYCGTKFAVHAISEALRSELADRAAEDENSIRVTVIAPGVVTTELPDSIVDPETRALSQKYYDNFTGPLLSQDIADAICYALQAPEHVNVNEVLVRPTRQVK